MPEAKRNGSQVNSSVRVRSNDVSVICHFSSKAINNLHEN